MALVTVQVQGADGIKQPVLLDSITGQSYAIPIYKLSVGNVGIDDGVISSDNPLPVSGVFIEEGQKVVDTNSRELLRKILLEMRKLNAGISCITEEEFKEIDLPDESL